MGELTRGHIGEIVQLYHDAWRAGLKISIEGERLRIRGPRKAEKLARKLLKRRQEVITYIRDIDDWVWEQLEKFSTSYIRKERSKTSLEIQHQEPEKPVQSPPVTPQTSTARVLGSQGGTVIPLAVPDCLKALAAFQSVGAEVDQVIFKNDITKELESDHKVSTEQFKGEVGEMILDAERGGVSLIARVRGNILQIDDCDAEATELLKPFAILIQETSENNFMLWLAFKDEQDKCDCRDRLFTRLKEIAPGANPGSGGATRWPGSINQKPGRRGWRVRLVYTNPGRTVTPIELEDAGLLADQKHHVMLLIPTLDGPGDRGAVSLQWPDYQKCLAAKPSRSEADAQFIWICLQRGFTPEAAAEKLAEVSGRAQQSGQQYIDRTVGNVAAWQEAIDR